MSRLRARCPDCGGHTAVALGPDYECHACGRRFAAGLVRVPRAWGEGGEAMAEAAWSALPYPETAVITEDDPAAQAAAVASALPERPVVLGGCCCAHVGAVAGLADRLGRISVVWVDAHGDLNTVESSPSGNAWGTPLRTLIDDAVVRPADVALVAARALDLPETDFIRDRGIALGAGAVPPAVADTVGTYVAIDFDALDSSEVAPFMPEPGGLKLEEAERLLAAVPRRSPVTGAGVSGLVPDARNTVAATRLLQALSL